MENLYLVSVGSVVLYVGWLLIMYGLLPSISYSVYKHSRPWLFFWFMFGVGFPLMVQGVYVQSYFMNSGGMLFILCGASPYFRSKNIYGDPNTFESILHSVGAEGGMIMLFLHLWFMEHEWVWLALMGVPVITSTIRKMNYETFWMEVIGFILISGGLWLKI